MNDQKDQVVQKLKDANNILVTVHSSPTVDQLAAAIALTLVLNKLNKHATAVFSGTVPSAIHFLRPEETIEKNTDSLRDFIVALDKAKADKLRYKVENDVVKIFITPYKTSISEKDLIFSQGDFNVDVVVALGVHQQQDLDEVITAHGRILHDATVITVNTTADAELGTINWQDSSASSMSELVTTVVTDLGENLLDSQIATALLTGVVSETDHFGNEKTTPHTMTVSAALLAAGANQQLVSNQLEMPDQAKNMAVPKSTSSKPSQPAEADAEEPKTDKTDDSEAPIQLPEPESKDDAPDAADDGGTLDIQQDNGHEDSLEELLHQADAEMEQSMSATLPAPVSAPTAGAALPPIAVPAPDEDAARSAAPKPPAETPAASTSSTVSDDGLDVVLDTGKTAADNKPETPGSHAAEPGVASAAGGVDDARKAVEDALKAGSDTPAMIEPLEALNAQSVSLDLGHENAVAPEAVPSVMDPNEAPGLPPYEPTPVPPASLNQPPQPPLPEQPPADSEPPAHTAGGMKIVQPLPESENPLASMDLSSYGSAPSAPVPPAGGMPPVQPPLTQLPPNPAVNEPAPLTMSPADQPFTMPLPPTGGIGGLQVPPPQTTPPTSVNLPPQGPPPPPVPPPLMPGPGMPQ